MGIVDVEGPTREYRAQCLRTRVAASRTVQSALRAVTPRHDDCINANKSAALPSSSKLMGYCPCVILNVVDSSYQLAITRNSMQLDEVLLAIIPVSPSQQFTRIRDFAWLLSMSKIRY